MEKDSIHSGQLILVADRIITSDIEPLASVCVITYNQEKFIRQTLDSILNQKTSFPIEILIHDDASTDHTQDFIKDYAVRFPTLIKPILQKENQLRKYGWGINPRFNFARALGQYIAICEGDDF